MKTLNLPDQADALSEFYLLALAIYREARGEVHDAKVAVGWTIKNRVLHPGWYGKTWFEVITKKYQFSSFNLGEVNSIVFGAPGENAWRESVRAATDVMFNDVADPTGGALFYFDRSLDKNPPKWAALYLHTADIGHFHFYKP